ncbi:ATP-binding protein [Phragmitibacter flavus]|uniref:ATP-binding protein n=1 Tax=Phragmitibacter flavus TaxID=2576071 RepID=A0A5R8KGL0_9BACT|nr:ATP-binding protein [Phragmitibacter flavus]TLD71444.1 ATP-binding protein [Phragmitibacter flavus]
MRTGSLSTKLDVNLYETERLNQMVRQFGKWHQMPDDAVFKISLSIDELVTNIVMHGGRKEPRAHEIVLRLTISNREVHAEIEDDGRAFNPLDAPTPDISASLFERNAGGMGIHLARTLMDAIHYSRIGQRNILTLTKRVA